MNAKFMMRKLQTALCARGQRVRINQCQRWSENAQRMTTRYIVQLEGEKTPIYNGYHAHEAVVAMAALLNDETARGDAG